MTPGDLNGAARLILIAKRCGSQFLDNADSFDEVVGRGSFAMYDSSVLNAARRVVKALRDRVLEGGIDPADPVKDLRDYRP